MLRATTWRPEIFDRSVIMSSVMPSEKYSCSGSPLILLNGKTAIDVLSDQLSEFGKRPIKLSRRKGLQIYAITGDWFSDVFHPLVPHWFETDGEFLLDLLCYLARHANTAGSASSCSRAAIFTPSP